MGVGKWAAIAALVALAGCVSPMGAGCGRYAEARPDMPRPLHDDALGRWVAVLDSGMTGACR